MPAARAPRRPTAEPGRRVPQVRFRLRITAGDVIAVGPGKISLLEAIRETGSITAAAQALDMSYRRAWLLLDELNRALERPAVDSAKGGASHGGSALTEVGQELIALYRRVEATAEQACRDDLQRMLALMAR